MALKTGACEQLLPNVPLERGLNSYFASSALENPLSGTNLSHPLRGTFSLTNFSYNQLLPNGYPKLFLFLKKELKISWYFLNRAYTEEKDIPSEQSP